MITVVTPTWTTDRAKKLHTNLKALSRFQNDYVAINGGGTLRGMILGLEAALDDNDLFLFMHDDVEVYEDGWDEAIIKSQVELKWGLAGFGGATSFGDPNIYKTPYQLQHLIRHNFISNMKDWRAHGSQVEEPTRVAFLDGFSLIFTKDAYNSIGGWQKAKAEGLPPFHSYDMWACIEALRRNIPIYMIPIACHHLGGLTSTTVEYEEWVKKNGYKNGQEVFEIGHKLCYENGRGVLPRAF